jgi:hypothetical protein
VVVEQGVPLRKPGIEEEGDTGEARHGLGEQFEPFPGDFRTIMLRPVMFPPGRARLATDLSRTGSKLTAMTMGMVLVVCLAARTAAGSPATIMSTGSRTSSAARSG